MTARIAGFVTRAQAGLRGPRSVSRNITPARGGVAGHYGGPAQPAAAAGSDHARCVRTWKGWQDYHMNTHGWADIAYTGGFCNHGYAFAGRGVGVRTAANGTNAGNQSFYAVTWIGGEGQTPTPEARDAFEWWVQNLRGHGAGRLVKPHRYFKATGCPGNPMVTICGALDGEDPPIEPKPEPQPPAPKPPAPTPEDDDMPMPPTLKEGDGSRAKPSIPVRRLQALLVAVHHNLDAEGGIDGIFGPGLKRELQAFQKARGLTADGICGPNTWKRLILG